MSITFAMPAMAGNKPNNHGKDDKAVVVNNHKSESHFDKADKMTYTPNFPTFVAILRKNLHVLTESGRNDEGLARRPKGKSTKQAQKRCSHRLCLARRNKTKVKNQSSFTQMTGRIAIKLLEHTGEMLRIFEAEQVAGLANGMAAGEKHLRPLHQETADVVRGRVARHLPDEVAEVVG